MNKELKVGDTIKTNGVEDTIDYMTCFARQGI